MIVGLTGPFRRICDVRFYRVVRVQGGEARTAEQRDFIEEVHYAVEDLLELIKTYQSKNRLTKVLMSTSFKRRHSDLEAAIDRALGRLQVSHEKRVSTVCRREV